MFEKEITFDRFIRGLMVVAGLGLAIYISFGVTLTVRLFAIFKKLNLGKVKLK